MGDTKRRAKLVKQADREAASAGSASDKISRAEMLTLLDEMLRIHNSENEAYKRKAQRLRKALESDN